MSDRIGGYRCLTPMQTAGSGSARWCFAARGLERFFLKEFLSPVYPVHPDTPLGARRLERCRQFERRKQRLYAASSCVIGDVLVPVIDFFRENGHYYAVSEAVAEGFTTADQAFRLAENEKRRILFELAVCLQRLHTQGVVHADLKPEHVLLSSQTPQRHVRLIDLDSGFLLDDPPMGEQEIEGDPAYLAPEAFLRMIGQEAQLGTALDVFAFGILIHQIWVGRPPEFDRERYHYLYEASLDGGKIRLDLPENWEPVVQHMLYADPMQRPSDAEIAALFMPERATVRTSPVRNGLGRLMKV